MSYRKFLSHPVLGPKLRNRTPQGIPIKGMGLLKPEEMLNLTYSVTPHADTFDLTTETGKSDYESVLDLIYNGVAVALSPPQEVYDSQLGGWRAYLRWAEIEAESPLSGPGSDPGRR